MKIQTSFYETNECKICFTCGTHWLRMKIQLTWIYSVSNGFTATKWFHPSGCKWINEKSHRSRFYHWNFNVRNWFFILLILRSSSLDIRWIKHRMIAPLLLNTRTHTQDLMKLDYPDAFSRKSKMLEAKPISNNDWAQGKILKIVRWLKIIRYEYWKIQKCGKLNIHIWSIMLNKHSSHTLSI